MFGSQSGVRLLVFVSLGFWLLAVVPRSLAAAPGDTALIRVCFPSIGETSPDCVDALELNYSFDAPPGGGGPGSGKPVLHNLSFKRYVDASSAQLRLRLVSGSVLNGTSISLAKKQGSVLTPTLVLSLHTVVVNKIEVSVSLDGVPIETVALTCLLLEETFFP